jgi:MATE family multidrug resistance protein
MSELSTIARHAGTVLIGQLAVMAFGIADTVIAGRYSPQALAVLSLASSIYISIYVALNGMLQALLPVWAQLRGAGRTAEIGQSVRQALYICAGAALIGCTALWFPQPWLSWTDVPQALWPEVRAYLQVLALALVPSLLFRMYSTLNQSLGYPRLVTWLQAGALLVKIPLSYALTFGVQLGEWQLQGMGVVGCAWATLGVNMFMLLTGLYLLRTQDIYQPYRLWQGMESPQWLQLRRFLQLGVPAGLSIMVEVTSFTLMALFIARLGAVASASHQCCTWCRWPWALPAAHAPVIGWVRAKPTKPAVPQAQGSRWRWPPPWSGLGCWACFATPLRRRSPTMRTSPKPPPSGWAGLRCTTWPMRCKRCAHSCCAATASP